MRKAAAALEAAEAATGLSSEAEKAVAMPVESASATGSPALLTYTLLCSTTTFALTLGQKPEAKELRETLIRIAVSMVDAELARHLKDESDRERRENKGESASSLFSPPPPGAPLGFPLKVVDLGTLRELAPGAASLAALEPPSFFSIASFPSTTPTRMAGDSMTARKAVA